jgi:hypothetical protein
MKKEWHPATKPLKIKKLSTLLKAYWETEENCENVFLITKLIVYEIILSQNWRIFPFLLFFCREIFGDFFKKDFVQVSTMIQFICHQADSAVFKDAGLISGLGDFGISSLTL